MTIREYQNKALAECGNGTCNIWSNAAAWGMRRVGYAARGMEYAGMRREAVRKALKCMCRASGEMTVDEAAGFYIEHW